MSRPPECTPSPRASVAVRRGWGSCLVTYRPDLIEPEQLERTDAVIALGQGGGLNRHIVDLLAGVSREPPERVSQQLATVGPGSGFLAVRSQLGESGAFRVGSRVTEHRRHMRKYLQVSLPPNRAFHFRDRDDRVVAVATNITDLQKILHDRSDGVLQHHAKGRDLSEVGRRRVRRRGPEHGPCRHRVSTGRSRDPRGRGAQSVHGCRACRLSDVAADQCTYAGGRRCAHGRASSRLAERLSSRASLPAPATSCMPMGRPSGVM
jgi:hypothetical protein